MNKFKSNLLCCKRAILAIVVLLCGSFSSIMWAESFSGEHMIAQQVNRTIRGVVKDQNGDPLVGVSITIVGTKTGIITGLDGDYIVQLPAGATQLKFSYLGFKEQTISVENKTTINVTMYEDNTVLDEVVIVGYGEQKKATLTGAIEQVSSKSFESRAVTNVGLALQGQTPGLVVSRTSPRPGNEELSFAIRGATSINGGSPLIIIDGVPALNDASFQNLNSDDIESISVLKDGAASIYGSRAANGVILVTTKKGKGKVSVDYNFNMRFNTPGITGFSPNMSQYATMWLEANKEEKVPNWWGWVSEENMLKMQQGIEGIYTTQYWGDIFLGDANRIDEMFATRYSYQHNLSIAGSSETSNYRLSAAFADNQGNLATAYDGQKQYNLRFNYDYKLSDRIKLETSASLVKTDTQSPSIGLDAALYGQEMPFFPAKNPFGQWYANYGTVGDRQPVAATSDGGRDNRSNLTTRVDLKAIIDIWNGISFEGMASFQNEEYRRERWVVPVQTYDWYGNPTSQVISASRTTLSTTAPGDLRYNNPGYLTVADNNFYQYYSALLKYDKKFNDIHTVSVVAGINAEKWQSKGLAAGRLNFTDDGVQDLDLADATTIGNSGGKSHRGLYSYLARVGYNYKDKYLIDLAGRSDGNSKFADGYRFKQYGSAQLAWVFTQEDLLQAITPVLSFGKLRLTYGSSGNDAGIGNYDYASLVGQATAVLGYPATLHNTAYLENGGLISLTRTWEKVEQKNIGIDLNFLNNKLNTSFDYFIKDNKGMLSSVAYPALLGGGAPKTNSGHLNVKGWEFAITWRDQIQDFSYFATFNISDTKTKLKELQGADTYGVGKNKTLNGYPLNSWFLYETDGFFQTQAEVDEYYTKYGSSSILSGLAQGSATELRPGDVRRVDRSGDGTLSPEGSEKSDLKYMGDGDPHFVFGLTLGGSWKGFDLNALFQGVGKQQIMRGGWMAYPFYALYTNQNPNFLGKTWTEDQPDAKYPRLSTYPARSGWNYGNNDYMLQNSRYIRLKSLVVGYTLPKHITKKVMLEKVRIYFSGNDIWETTSIKDGFDPEMGEMSQNVGYPFYRTWSFGVNIGF